MSQVTQTLQELQTVAMEKKDFHLADFIQREFLGKKVEWETREDVGGNNQIPGEHHQGDL